MDYRGLYADLAGMKRRALNEFKRCAVAGNSEQADDLDSFIWEIEDFLNVIATRRW